MNEYAEAESPGDHDGNDDAERTRRSLIWADASMHARRELRTASDSPRKSVW